LHDLQKKTWAHAKNTCLSSGRHCETVKREGENLAFKKSQSPCRFKVHVVELEGGRRATPRLSFSNVPIGQFKFILSLLEHGSAFSKLQVILFIILQDEKKEIRNKKNKKILTHAIVLLAII
jgi:hypothetical protein